MESRDGWSGCSRSESKQLWDCSGGECLWSTLRRRYATCDMPLDNACNLLSAANEVALDILLAATEFAPNAQVQLVEDLQNVSNFDSIPSCRHLKPHKLFAF